MVATSSSRTEDEVKRSQHCRGNTASRGSQGGAAQGKDKMGHDTLWHSKWDLGSKDGGS